MMAAVPRNKMRMAATTKVYGRLIASLTIHMSSLSGWAIVASG
jgi:hypothetical protein